MKTWLVGPSTASPYLMLRVSGPPLCAPHLTLATPASPNIPTALAPQSKFNNPTMGFDKFHPHAIIFIEFHFTHTHIHTPWVPSESESGLGRGLGGGGCNAPLAPSLSVHPHPPTPPLCRRLRACAPCPRQFANRWVWICNNSYCVRNFNPMNVSPRV